MNGSRYCLSSYLQSGHWRDDVLQMIDHCSLIGKDWHYHRIINSNSCIRLTNYFQEFHLQEEVEPFVIGDGTVTVLVHRLENNLPLQCSPYHCHHDDQGEHEQDLEAGVPLLLGLERRRQSEPLLVCRWDRDHCCKLVAGHLVVVFSHSTILMTMMLMQMEMIKDLPITISISGLEALPAEPVDLLVALRGGVANLETNQSLYLGGDSPRYQLFKKSWRV